MTRYYGTAAWKRLRLQALERDGWTCTVPGAAWIVNPPVATLKTKDHACGAC